MGKKMWILAVCLLMVGVMNAQELKWFHNPQEALDTAQKNGQIVFTDMFTTWCHWCKKLDEQTFSHPSFKEIAVKFVLLKVDGDVYVEFRKKYNIKGYPTMLFLDAKGVECHDRVVGFLPPDELVPIMKEALDSARSEELSWYTVPEEALTAATGNNKPVFTDVSTTWCHWCKKLDEETFSAPSFQQESRRFVLLKVDGDAYPDFVSKYAVKGYPTMLFLNKDGAEIHERVVGFLPASALVPIMREVGARAERYEYSLAWIRNYDEAVAASLSTGKPIFTWASMKGCYWCDKLEKETFTTPEFINISEKFVLLKLMREEEPKFMEKYAVKGYPTMLFLNAKGEEFYQKVVGYLPASKLVPLMAEALKAHPGN